ncbi:dipeptide ABC transporter ATP-binding protein [Paenalkalicoccus suaedae]|uniref:Dipeptide ABC transporter ATP-binding protein n=1 Tax=Paenalkalicoccus suaedae TaxID=2592382 RepID=A0A859FAF0_9BACI|nr:dipeptide ABC transporter ATP-binding protein [Paenalkalicoccus suaedae]QKS69768.1 dipeptide ABC transporter ATP-binding protein [Paenalkalicoccus suaedae]
MSNYLLDVKSLKIYFPQKSGILKNKKSYVKAVDDISFSIKEGETLGLVGESGCGKSTTGRGMIRLVPTTEGEILFNGRNLAELSSGEMREQRKDMQMVFQDPYASLNPRLTVERILAEPLKAHGVTNKKEQRKRIEEMLEVVGLNKNYLHRYAHEFSGGQRQRIGIARALILNPKLIIADEPVAALDVSIQAQVLNLMKDLQEQFGLTYLFISHDLSVVRHLCNRVAVMYLGRIVEIGDTDTIYENHSHPYTQTLLAAIPVSNPRQKRERIILQGDVPSPVDPPKGCAFVGRCPKVHDRCHEVRPQLQVLPTGQEVACHLYDEQKEEAT